MIAQYRRRLWPLFSLLLLAVPVHGQAPLTAGQRSAIRQANGRVIVTFKPAGSAGAALRQAGDPMVSPAQLEEIKVRLEERGVIHSLKRLPSIGAVVAEVSDTELDRLAADSNVMVVEPDVWMPLLETGPTTVAPFGAQRDQVTPWGVTQVTAPEAWAVAGQGAGIKVGIMDSGGDIDHPDLNWAGGYDFTSGSASPSAWDDNISVCNGHGTHVAGTVAAADNGIGVVGVAPAVSLYALKVFRNTSGSCGAFVSDQISALAWADSAGIRVVNSSLGGSTYVVSYAIAITNAAAHGTYLVAAAGNTGSTPVQYPAAYPASIAVASLSSSNTRSSFSSYGPEIDIAGPGQSIYSTMPGGVYGTKSGTSMASPHVAGVVALLLAHDPSLTIDQVKTALADGALDTDSPGWDQYTGAGLARAYNSMGGSPTPQPLVLAVSPGSRSASVQAGSSAPGASATVTLSGDGSSSTGWTASARKSWTTLTTGSGTGSGTVAWSRNATGLAAGTYVDTITVTASGASGSPARVIDTLVVTPAPVPLALAVSPTSRSVTAQAGTSAPSDSASITLSGDGSGSAAWTATKRKSWTTLTTASGTGSGRVRWSRSLSGLAAGTYVDTITVTASGATGSPTRVIDTLVVTAAPVPLALAVSPTSRNVAAQVGTSAPNDSASVTLSGDGSGSAAWTATKRKSWTTLTTASGTGSGRVRWSRSLSGLAAGTYVDTITVTAVGATGSPTRVIDTLVVTAAPVPLALAVSPTSRNVAAQAGTSAPNDSASITLSGDGSGSAAWTATKRKSWTTLTTASGTGSGRVRWSRSLSGLAAGTYVDTITVTAVGATGSPSRVIDTLVVTAAPVPLALAVSPSSRRVTAQAGTSAPNDSATVTLSGDGSSSAGWIASKRKSWTTLTTTSGTGSGRVRWSRSLSGLAAGTYVDTITVSAFGATGSPTRVIDTLVVTAAPVPLALAVAPGSRYAAVQAGSSAPGASATVTLSGDGSGSAAWTASKRKSWTTLTTASGTGSGTVAWSRNAAGLAAGTYVDTITVSAAGASGSPTRVIDTLVVTPAPVPLAIAVSPGSRRATAQAGSTAPGDSATVTLTGDGSGSAGWVASKRKSWTTLITGSGNGSGRVRWSRNLSGLAAGTYVDTITVSAFGASGSPTRVIDTLVVTAAPVPLALAVSPASRHAAVQVGTTAPGDSATVSLSGDGSGTSNWVATKRQSWTTLITGSGTGSGRVRWSRDVSGLAAGTYVDTITVTANGATGSPARVIDTLVVSTAPVPLALAVAPGSRHATTQEGTAAPGDSAEVILTGDASSSTGWTASKRKGWTTLTTASGTGSGLVRWSRDASGLAAGTYVDTITVVAAGAAGSPTTVIDTLVVTAPPAPLVVAFTAITGGANITLGDPAPSGAARLTLSGDGAESAQWVASHQASWLSLQQGAGVGSQTLGWSRSVAGLVAGTYVDTIRVQVSGVTGAPAMLVDSLVIRDPVAPPPSAEPVLTLGRGGRKNTENRLPGRGLGTVRDSVQVAQASVGTSSNEMWSATSSGNWLAVQTSSGQGSGQIRFDRRLTSLADGMHVDTITVTLVAHPEVQARYVDSVLVATVPAPPARDVARDLFRGGGLLTSAQRAALDDAGNHNGRFDLGDLLAWIRSAQLSLSASEMAEVQEIIAASPVPPTPVPVSHESETPRARPRDN